MHDRARPAGSPFHAGEAEVQRLAGVGAMAARVGNSIHDTVPAPAALFLADRRWVVVGTVDADGRPWASVLAGAVGFARAVDGRTVRLAAAPLPGDPLAGTLARAAGAPDADTFIGLVAPDLATRRRMRVNGRLAVGGDGALLIHVDQAYANCPKYIQRRDTTGPAPTPAAVAAHGVGAHAAALTAEQRAWIRGADTFFIATANPGEGADASHRGGLPGFVRVETAQGVDRLVWPDYAGNAMFNTLGNIATYPRAGLLFPDFTTGRTLQVTGRAAIDWTAEHAATVPGAERLVTLLVEAVVELAGSLPLEHGPPEPSPFNPPVGAAVSA